MAWGGDCFVALRAPQFPATWFKTPDAAALFSHDRGDSVALAFLELMEKSDSRVHITRQFITNGNIYLPLANLTEFQKRLLDPSTSAAALKQTSAAARRETGDVAVHAAAPARGS